MPKTAPYFFNCFQCGKCCDSGPAIGAEEIFEYQDDFVISLRVNGMPMSYSENEDAGFSREEFDSLVEHAKTLWPVLDSPISSEKRIVILGFCGLDFAYGRRKCKFVGDNGQCQMYDRRPYMCRSVPFDPAFPVDLQNICLDRFKKYGCISHDHTQGELIFDDGQIHGDFAWQCQSKLNAMRADGAFYQAVSSMASSPDGHLFEFVRKYAREFSGADWVEVSPFHGLVALGMAHSSDPTYTDKILAFIDSQERLIKEGIDHAMRTKDKALRERTNTYRLFLKDYVTCRSVIEHIRESLKKGAISE